MTVEDKRSLLGKLIQINVFSEFCKVKIVAVNLDTDPSVKVIVSPIDTESAIFFWDFYLGPNLRNYIDDSSWIESSSPAICLTEEEVAALFYQKGLFFTLTEEDFTFLNSFEELCNSINSELNK